MGILGSRVGPIAVHLPERAETNEMLQQENPKWDMPLIEEKIGIRNRYIARPNETASDLGVAAAEKLFNDCGIDRRQVDFLLLCTQTPDYPLPTTSCLMQDRLGLRTNIGALDFNLGCSGFIYGLGLADGLIRSGSVRNVLLITAETYSKYIGSDDRSLRPIFGDGAAATLIEPSTISTLNHFIYGTDGSGAGMLLVNRGGARQKEDALQPTKRHRWSSPLCMDGPALIDFTLSRVPGAVDEVLTRAGLTMNDIDYFLVHQASAKLLGHLRDRLGLDEVRMPTVLADYGNTVSSTLPIMIRDMRKDGRLKPGKRSMMIGFGVGLSWGACLWDETYATI
jgi:3-oxoacyl-[acyl-carrier-protein] synthase-3